MSEIYSSLKSTAPAARIHFLSLPCIHVTARARERKQKTDAATTTAQPLAEPFRSAEESLDFNRDHHQQLIFKEEEGKLVI